jgi:glycosyltransferase involved in cell wall biosynthesis
MEKDKTKVLIISQYFPPDISGGGTRAYNFAQCLATENFDVTVITAFPHLHETVPNEFSKKKIVKEQMENFSIIRVWIPSILHSSVRNRIVLHFCFIISSLFPIFSIRPKIIFASEPNLFSIVPAFLYSKIRGGKVIRVVDDLWPELFYEREIVKSKILKKLLNRLAKFSYDYPKYILPLTEEAKLHISKLYKINLKKIFVVKHGVNTKIFKPNKEKIQKEFVIMYSGALVESYDFELIIQAADKLQNENIKFVIRGKGPLLEYIKKRKKELKLDNLVIDEKIIPFSDLSKYLSSANVFVVPMKDDYFLNLSLPTKILEFQALSKPIICCSNGAPGKHVQKTKSGITIPCNNLTELILAIRKLQNESNLCEELGKNGEKFVEENATFEKIGKELKQIIQTMQNDNNNK